MAPWRDRIRAGYLRVYAVFWVAMATSAALAKRVRDRGLRLTSQRLAVLAAIEEHPDHPDATEIAAATRRRVGSISTQAVYNVLEALTEAGLIRRIEPAGSPALYETRVGDNHHHVVCRSCGMTVDVACVVGPAHASNRRPPMGSSSTRPRSRSGVSAAPAGPRRGLVEPTHVPGYAPDLNWSDSIIGASRVQLVGVSDA